LCRVTRRMMKYQEDRIRFKIIKIQLKMGNMARNSLCHLVRLREKE